MGATSLQGFRYSKYFPQKSRRDANDGTAQQKVLGFMYLTILQPASARVSL